MLTTAEVLTVEFEGDRFRAERIARGAAYELFSDVRRDGFSANPHGVPAYHRVVHASDVAVLGGPDRDHAEPIESAITIPLSRTLTWSVAHKLTQSRAAVGTPTLRHMRDSAEVRPGTRMVKILSGRQVAGYLRGWLPMGFCHREYDVAHLRTPAELAVLATDGRVATDTPAIFALRWRAAGAEDFAIPYAANVPGLIDMPAHDRLGAPVLGTGFALSSQHIIPEFVTAEMLDLPLPAHAELVAFTAEGVEVLLYTYLAEQHAWARMAGPSWYHLLADAGIAPDQEYFPATPPPTRMLGLVNGRVVEAVAEPPGDFWLLAKVRALRQPVTDPARRTPIVTWRQARCSLVRDGGDWCRLRLTEPDAEAVARLGATCVERGVYEVWAPAGECVQRSDRIVRYGSAPS